MALTNTKIANARPKAKPYKMADEKGLFLLVQPSGGMLWQFRYRIDGRDASGAPKRIEKKLGLGTYPEVSLKEARNRRDDARIILAKGIDPAEKKRKDAHAAKIGATNTFIAVVQSCIAKCSASPSSIRWSGSIRRANCAVHWSATSRRITRPSWSQRRRTTCCVQSTDMTAIP